MSSPLLKGNYSITFYDQREVNLFWPLLVSILNSMEIKGFGY